MEIYRSDIKRSLTSWGFWTGAAGMLIAILIGASESLLPVLQKGPGEGLANGFHAQLILKALSSDVMLLCVPILCALPYTSAFVDDVKSGYLTEYLPRTGRVHYIRGKVFATALSGALALILGIGVSYLVFTLAFTPMELAPEVQEGVRQPTILVEVLARSSLYFLCGGLWSLVGALFASFTMSRYMAYASPFIIYYVLIILCERYIKDIYVLNPKEWLNPAGAWPGGRWGVALFLAELIVILVLCLWNSMARRLANG